MTVGFIIFAISIQMLKGDYREATWEKGEEGGISTLTKAYDQSQAENKFFSTVSLAQSNIRINQGYIITHIMKQVPEKTGYARGYELLQILEAAFMPRFLSPSKLRAGNRDIFIRYTRIPVRGGTSMALSSIGDAYINFAVTGGCIFMLFLGLLYNEILKKLHKHSKDYPLLLLFTPLIFLYPIRPDCELQTILGHLVKSSFLIFVVFQLWKKDFYNKVYYSFQRKAL